MRIKHLLTLAIIGLMASYANQSVAQCDPNHPNSHELENATAEDITWEAFFVNPANPCTILYTQKGTLNSCSAICLIPKTGSEVVVAIEVSQNGSTFIAGNNGACSTYSYTATGATESPCPSGTAMTMTLKYNGWISGTVYEP